jgi:hypothetical protein
MELDARANIYGLVCDILKFAEDKTNDIIFEHGTMSEIIASVYWCPLNLKTFREALFQIGTANKGWRKALVEKNNTSRADLRNLR